MYYHENMIKTNKVLLVSTAFVAAGSIAVSALILCKNKLFLNVRGGVYTLIIDKDNPLDGGNVSTQGGTVIHFDEYGVNENVDSGLLELAAYGSVALQSYINGIQAVRVYSLNDGDFCIAAGATPNSCEFTSSSSTGYCSLNLKDGFEADLFYFSVHNKTDSPIKLDKIEIDYSCVDEEAALRHTINDYLCAPQYITFDWNEYNPYYGYEIPADKIPSNRKLIKTMSEDEYPVAPGTYTYGYEVYDTDNVGNPRKLLYTQTKSFRIIGMSTSAPDERRIITFHIPDENGKEKLVFQETFQARYDLTNIPNECLKYNWDSPYNCFVGIGDEHYYPIFNVTGISPNKEGDGCNPVYTSYSYLERGFTMPEPTMKPGYRFGGWYLDAELTKPFDENKMHPGNLVLYANCIKTDLEVKNVYYHNEDGELSDHVDHLLSDDTQITLPEARTIMDLPRPMIQFRWAIFSGSNYLGIYKQTDTSKGTTGDKIKYSDFSAYHGDIDIYATDIKEFPDSTWSYELIGKDVEGNNVYQHTMMASSYMRDYDFVIPAVGIKAREDHDYYYDEDEFTIDRTGQFFVTDEKKAYIYDGGTLNSISSYGYGNITMRKPLSGILRHEGVRKVGRRAFFNRYGLKGTYFPKYATEFDIEAYANVKFNGILTLPKGLTKIGDRCFMGSENILFVCLPRSIKTIAPNAFAYGVYNSTTRVYENIHNRNGGPGEYSYSPFTLLYEGSESDFNKLDDSTKAAITNNASRIIYNYSYGTYYGRG